MTFNYYSFILNGKERIYYTYAINDTKEEILDWAEMFSFISESEVNKCTNVRALTSSEVEARNKELYKQWWNEHKNDDSLCGQIPPTIGEAQLN